MGSVRRYLVVVVLALLTCGCGVLDADEEINGYLLYEDSPRVEGVYFVHFVENDGELMGWMHTAYPASNPGLPSVYLNTDEIDGTVDDENILIRQIAGASYTDYQGTIEGGQMRLTKNVRSDLLTYEGEEATFEDFGTAAQELAIEEE